VHSRRDNDVDLSRGRVAISGWSSKGTTGFFALVDRRGCMLATGRFFFGYLKLGASQPNFGWVPGTAFGAKMRSSPRRGDTAAKKLTAQS
jgi:hypothetical protein